MDQVTSREQCPAKTADRARVQLRQVGLTTVPAAARNICDLGSLCFARDERSGVIGTQTQKRDAPGELRPRGTSDPPVGLERRLEKPTGYVRASAACTLADAATDPLRWPAWPGSAWPTLSGTLAIRCCKRSTSKPLLPQGGVPPVEAGGEGSGRRSFGTHEELRERGRVGAWLTSRPTIEGGITWAFSTNCRRA